MPWSTEARHISEHHFTVGHSRVAAVPGTIQAEDPKEGSQLMPYDFPSRPLIAFAFGRFALKPTERVLEHDGEPVQVGSRAFDILVALLEHPGEVVSHRALIDRAWPGLTVEAANLRVHIANLRKVFAIASGAEKYITNVPGRGYSITVPVRREESDPGQKRPKTHVRGASSQPDQHPHLLARDDDLARVVQLVGSRQLVSIIGAGGVGKTALALRLEQLLDAQFPDGVYHVDLSNALAPAEAITLLDRSLCAGLGPEWRSGREARCAGRALIVLDTCEHLTEAVAALSGQILSALPEGRILLTSREATRSPNEHVHVLKPLPLPMVAETNLGVALAAPSVKLFMRCAEAGGYVEDIAEQDVPHLVSICHNLDGNPLAIEIVSRSVSLHGFRGTASLIENAEWALALPLRGMPARHRTIAASIGWSYDLLPPRDQLIMQRLSEFQGAFTLEAAEEIVVDQDISGCCLQNALSRMLETSLVVETVSNGSTRYRLPNLVKLFARSTLNALSPTNSALARHARMMSGAVAERMSAVSPRPAACGSLERVLCQP
jgi:predicted ATPase/DNA-binding winged helix-turn-helix (wHTH) protein